MANRKSRPASNRMNKKLFVIIALIALFSYALVHAADTSKLKKYEGIITQMNNGDGSFIVRLRDGSFITVTNPLAANVFLGFKGLLDPLKKTVDNVTEINIKDASGTDAIPFLASIDPGSGDVGTKVTISGIGFTKKTNSVSVGSFKNAIVNVPSTGGTLIFSLPQKPCDKKLKTNCATTKLSLVPGSYNIVVSNENGISNAIPFTINPSSALTMINENLPQVLANTEYKVILSGLGGSEDYVWKVFAGTLPPGLSLVLATCAIEIPCRATATIKGKPSAPGVYSFTIALASGAEYVSKQFTLTVVRPLNMPTYN